MKRLFLLCAFILSLVVLTGCEDLRETTRGIREVTQGINDVTRNARDVVNTVENSKRDLGHIVNAVKDVVEDLKENTPNDPSTITDKDLAQSDVDESGYVTLDKYIEAEKKNIASKLKSMNDRVKLEKILSLLSNSKKVKINKVLTSSEYADLVEDDDYFILGKSQQIVITKSAIYFNDETSSKVDLTKLEKLSKIIFGKKYKSKKEGNGYVINNKYLFTGESDDYTVTYTLTMK